MAINIYQIQLEAEQNGWQLKSNKYTNLHTPLDWVCSKGHEVSIPYDEWRKLHSCPECNKQDSGGVMKNAIVPKKNDSDFRVLCLDAATNITGWSIYDNGKLTSYGTFVACNNSDPTVRIHDIKEWIKKKLAIWKADAIGLEGIQLQHNNVKGFQTLANLQGVLLDMFYEMNIKYEVANSSAWRAYIGINHRAERSEAKDETRKWVMMNHKLKCTEDEADAISMGRYFCHQFQITKQPSWGEQMFL